MTEHFTREEAVALASKISEDDDYEFNLVNAAITTKQKEWEALGAVAYWGRSDAAGNITDGISPEEKIGGMAVWEAEYSVPLYTHALPAQPAEPVNAELVDACGRYEAALMAAFPNGAHGEAFTQWNEARKLLAKRAQATAHFPRKPS